MWRVFSYDSAGIVRSSKLGLLKKHRLFANVHCHHACHIRTSNIECFISSMMRMSARSHQHAMKATYQKLTLL